MFPSDSNNSQNMSQSGGDGTSNSGNVMSGQISCAGENEQ